MDKISSGKVWCVVSIHYYLISLVQSCFPSWSIDIPHVLFLVSKFRFYFIKVLRKIISWFRSLNEFSTAINLSQGWRCRTGSSAALLTSTEQDQPLLARPHLPVSLCGIQCCWNISAWRRAGPRSVSAPPWHVKREPFFLSQTLFIPVALLLTSRGSWVSLNVGPMRVWKQIYQG